MFETFMNVKNLVELRLRSQHIAAATTNTPQQLVHYMGAMQAQDYLMAKWAVGIRLPGSTDDQIQAAVDNGDIIRTHVMRPTWHFVAPQDVYWMLDLTAANIRKITKGRHKQLDITDSILKKSFDVITQYLAKAQHATREELVAILTEAKIPTDDNRAAHILMEAELEQLICNGVYKRGKLTYALLCDRVKTVQKLPKEDALATLLKRYVASHCPATLKDFVWWSGLSVTDAKSALESVKEELHTVAFGNITYLFATDMPTMTDNTPIVHLLPGFDEYIIGYRDRSAVLLDVHTKLAISNNGIFKPVIIKDGKAIGLWKSVRKPGTIAVETSFFKDLAGDNITMQLEQEIKRFIRFTGREMQKP